MWCQELRSRRQYSSRHWLILEAGRTVHEPKNALTDRIADRGFDNRGRTGWDGDCFIVSIFFDHFSTTAREMGNDIADGDDLAFPKAWQQVGGKHLVAQFRERTGLWEEYL